MNSPTLPANDTICAISTPPGTGGIAVCRVSGNEAIAITGSVWRGKPLDECTSHTAHLGEITDSEGMTLDQCVATVFRAPRSFTGEDVVEIAVHGSRYVQRELLNSLIAAGARMAQPGEFTRRAFIAGKMDLAEAEAVADIIASESRASLRIALRQMKGGFSQRLSQLRQQLVELVALMELELDFSEEDVQFASRSRLLDIATQISNEVTRLHRSFASGSAIKEGIPVAIVGETNAGKSSLLNLILGDNRAIVSDIHGTTRDTIEETAEIGDYKFRFIDTAGMRPTDDEIERIGISRSVDALNRANIILMVCDITQPLNAPLLTLVRQAAEKGSKAIIIANKADTGIQPAPDLYAAGLPVITMSAITGHGFSELCNTLTGIMDNETDGNDILVTNARHAQALALAAESAARIISGLEAGLPGDLVSQDIRETISHLASITGDIPSTEILTTIFSRFCIGK